ncbi:MLP-like protein 43 isoform X1 [Bidens hawaiensis]|uniref:MLP-like protein 43 isoform X1 n=1 Tax=Bidens hawaiensis TaxID=980011 RepID=UPI0040495AFF
MALSGKLIAYVEISKGGDVFHDFIRHKPHELVAISPDKVHDCELHEGERGAVGSVFTWHYAHEGKKQTSKQIIESVNEENHTIVLKVIGGVLVDGIYKSFTNTFHVEPKGDKQVATWTFEFEKLDTRVPYPTAEMDYLCNLIKHLDAHNGTK